MLAVGCGACHCFGGADETFGRLHVEEGERLEIVVFGGFQDVQRYAESFACVIYSVKEVEEDLGSSVRSWRKIAK